MRVLQQLKMLGAAARVAVPRVGRPSNPASRSPATVSALSNRAVVGPTRGRRAPLSCSSAPSCPPAASAPPNPTPSSPTGWRVNVWVKQGILLGFRFGDIVDMGIGRGRWPFFDKDTLPLKPLDTASGVRIVPGGSSIRDGAYLGSGVICMPPMYINVGAYVGDGTLVDSHALVGSCAQIGKRVHLSAAAQIGGVIEPVGAMPVIVEDDVLIGGNCGVYEGAVVKRRAVLASGTILTGSTPVYDLPNERIIKPEPGQPLVVPEGAVVVPGARPSRSAPAANGGCRWRRR